MRVRRPEWAALILRAECLAVVLCVSHSALVPRGTKHLGLVKLLLRVELLMEVRGGSVQTECGRVPVLRDLRPC